MPTPYLVQAYAAIATMEGEERMCSRSLGDFIEDKGDPFYISEVIDGKAVRIRVYPVYLEDEDYVEEGECDVAEVPEAKSRIKEPHFASNR